MQSEFERKRDEKFLRQAWKEPWKHEWIRVPIISRMYEIDGEMHYEIEGENIPRKWSDYNVDDFQ